MRAFGSILLGLFRPGKGLDGAGAAVKWLWVPLVVILLGSVLIKVGIATPMKAEAQRAQIEQALQTQTDAMSDSERAEYDKAMADAEASGDLTQEEVVDTASSITSIADLVFGALGAVVAVLYIATYFFVAAKTWANPVKYTTMLTVASLSLLPHAIRNVIQAIYTSSSGVWLQYSGLGALVAPADSTQAPGAAYAILSQIDLFVVWGLVILLGALISKTVGIERKRAVPALAAFIVITGVLQALPTIVSSLLAGAMM